MRFVRVVVALVLIVGLGFVAWTTLIEPQLDDDPEPAPTAAPTTPPTPAPTIPTAARRWSRPKV